ncbi:uncharacterized protein LOC133179883 [Saccostrea echinata]|uniref:uncharacterized protein LOC133179861 n=1 Tax=Saccostrea echinata TaxID=191078 RepID=UPI002A82DA59|nr:uncharacterized protein LOC133179861 [Saccostrea echinata]XP_061170553.1 uncharacterized protein LOC133179883 [Saccostrea echinata]
MGMHRFKLHANGKHSFTAYVDEKCRWTCTVGPDNISGYTKVLALADSLVTLRDKATMTTAQVQQLKDLWSALSEYDRRRTVFPSLFSKDPGQGRFRHKQKKVAPGVESIERVILGPNQSPAQWPNCNRYT